MPQAVTDRVTIREGDRATVELVRDPRPSLAPLPLPPALAGATAAAVAVEPCAVAVYYLHTRWIRTTGALNEYRQISLETSVLFTDRDGAVLRNTLLDGLERVEVLGSRREAWTTARVSAGTAATDGLLLALLFERVRGEQSVERRVEILAQSSTWARRVPLERRLAALDADLGRLGIGTEGRLAVQAARDEAAKEALEAWTLPSLEYAGREGTARPALDEGAWTLGLTTWRHLQPWKGYDAVNFLVTEDPFPRGRGSAPVVRVGAAQSSSAEVFAAPVVWRYLVRWLARYIIGTAFFFSEVSIPQTGTFLDAIPLLPYPYKFGAGTGANGAALSDFVKQKQTYFRMLEADRAHEVWGLLFFIILVDRVQGEVWLIEFDQPAGTLCAVVKVAEQGGEQLTRYVWRKTPLDTDQETVDVVPLNTEEVIGSDLIIVVPPNTP